MRTARGCRSSCGRRDSIGIITLLRIRTGRNGWAGTATTIFTSTSISVNSRCPTGPISHHSCNFFSPSYLREVKKILTSGNDVFGDARAIDIDFDPRVGRLVCPGELDEWTGSSTTSARYTDLNAANIGLCTWVTGCTMQGNNLPPQKVMSVRDVGRDFHLPNFSNEP